MWAWSQEGNASLGLSASLSGSIGSAGVTPQTERWHGHKRLSFQRLYFQPGLKEQSSKRQSLGHWSLVQDDDEAACGTGTHPGEVLKPMVSKRWKMAEMSLLRHVSRNRKPSDAHRAAAAPREATTAAGRASASVMQPEIALQALL